MPLRFRDPGVHAPSAEHDPTPAPNARNATNRTPGRVQAAKHVLRRWNRNPTHSGYFKTRDLAEPLGLTQKQLRPVMPELQDRGYITCWNPDTDSPKTWRVTIDSTD